MKNLFIVLCQLKGTANMNLDSVWTSKKKADKYVGFLNKIDVANDYIVRKRELNSKIPMIKELVRFANKKGL